MLQASNDNAFPGRRYALCVGIGTYTHLLNRNLRFAVNDANAIAERLADPQRGNFVTTLCIEPTQTTKAALDEAMEELLSASDRQADDLIVIYFSCHGDVYNGDTTFCLLPSDATKKNDGMFEQTTVMSIHDFARWFSKARTQNIVVLLDVCHSGGAGAALQHFKLDLSAGPNFFIIGAARLDQVTRQSSQLQHGLFTHCLLRAFEQSPTQDGWLTVSQIHNFISDEIRWFAKDRPAPIQSWSVSINPNLPLLRNPYYPELCPLPPLWNVPLQRNIFFTGQEDLLSRLARVLQREQKSALTQPHAINGLGGIGKTQLALEYAYQHRQDYHAILWGRADTREALISTFVNIAHLLDLPQKDEKDVTVIVEAVKTWLAGRSQWLLILDNADEPGIVKEFIPPAFQGHLLLTTRAQATGALAHKIEVEAMRPEVGAILLLRRARLIAQDALLEHASPTDVTVAKELSEGMGGLPLALDQAGAYIEEVSCTLRDYQQLYQTRRAELLKERGGVMPDHPESVATTFSMSFEKIASSNPAAIDLLQLCAFFHPDTIPEEIFTKGAEYLSPRLQATANDPLTLNKAIKDLGAYSFIHRDGTSHTLTIHRLVQAVQIDMMETEVQRQWAEKVVKAVNTVFPDNPQDMTTWSRHRRYLDQAQTCNDLIERYGLHLIEGAALLNRAGLYLVQSASYTIAKPLLRHALQICERRLGSKCSEVAGCLNNLGALSYAEGRYTEAESLYQRALSIEGMLYSETARESLNNLALLYKTQGKYKQAEPLYQLNLLIQEQQLGANHSGTALSLNNLAELYRAQGKYEQAKPLYIRALSIREQQLGSSHPDTAQTLNNLGLLYYNQRKYEQAEPLLMRALSIREQRLESSHPDIALSLNSLGLLYYNQRKYEQAEPLLMRALSIREQRLGTLHPYTATSLNNLALLYSSQKRYEQAEPLLIRALAINEQKLGATHPEVALYLNNLGLLYQAQGKYKQAEPLYRRALAINEQELGVEHPRTQLFRANYVSLLREMWG